MFFVVLTLNSQRICLFECVEHCVRAAECQSHIIGCRNKSTFFRLQLSRQGKKPNFLLLMYPNYFDEFVGPVDHNVLSIFTLNVL
jgi:hypothetical protein